MSGTFLPLLTNAPEGRKMGNDLESCPVAMVERTEGAWRRLRRRGENGHNKILQGCSEEVGFSFICRALKGRNKIKGLRLEGNRFHFQATIRTYYQWNLAEERLEHLKREPFPITRVFKQGKETTEYAERILDIGNPSIFHGYCREDLSIRKVVRWAHI